MYGAWQPLAEGFKALWRYRVEHGVLAARKLQLFGLAIGEDVEPYRLKVRQCNAFAVALPKVLVPAQGDVLPAVIRRNGIGTCGHGGFCCPAGWFDGYFVQDRADADQSDGQVDLYRMGVRCGDRNPGGRDKFLRDRSCGCGCKNTVQGADDIARR